MCAGFATGFLFPFGTFLDDLGAGTRKSSRTVSSRVGETSGPLGVFVFFRDFGCTGVLVPFGSFGCDFSNCSNRISASCLVLTTASCWPLARIIYFFPKGTAANWKSSVANPVGPLSGSRILVFGNII